MTPKRVQEVLDGGSLYRVFKGFILCRQRILAVDTIGGGAASRCEITLDPAPVLVAPTPRRPFQGWRYLDPREAPELLAWLQRTGHDVDATDVAADWHSGPMVDGSVAGVLGLRLGGDEDWLLLFRVEQLQDVRWAVGVTVLLLAWSAWRLARAQRRWQDPVTRSRVVATVAG